MTKKDYQLIAYTLADARTKLEFMGTRLSLVQYTALCNNFTHTLLVDNPRFDRDKFLQACGVND